MLEATKFTKSEHILGKVIRIRRDNTNAVFRLLRATYDVVHEIFLLEQVRID
jgi:hypothetical protein